MSSGLNNTRLGMEAFLNVVDEFKRFIGGGGSNQNLFSFLDKNNEEEKELLDILLKAAPERSTEEEEFEDLKRNLFFPLLDNMMYAYSMNDIVSDVTRGKIFPNVKDTVKLSKYMYYFYEHASGYNFYDAQMLEKRDPRFAKSTKQTSIIKMVTPITTKYTAKPLDEFKNDSDFKKEDPKTNKQVPVKGNFASSTSESDKVFINGGNPGAAPPEPSRYGSPALGAFVMRRPDVGIMSRNADPINIFFNAISPLEMSRCTPYINVAVVSLQDEVRPKQMSNVTFMRFIDANSDGSYVLDENIGLQKAKPYGFDVFASLFNKNRIDEEVLNDVSLMDIFASTQMVANADINNPNSSIKKTGLGRHVLEPISPFLTLNSVSVDISGMGIALFSSKIASMELTLHDRSRLSDISNLVAPNQFGMTKVILEYGWSHPEGGVNSENKIGQFLNSARDRGIFTVKSSNFDFSDGNTVKVSLSLSCYGSDESKSVSAAAGSQVPLSVFKPTIKKILNDVVEKKQEDKESDKGKNLRLREVRHLVNLSQRNAVGTDALVTYEKFTEAIKLYKETLKSGAKNKIPNAAFIKAIGGLMSNNDINLGDNPNIDTVKEKLKNTKIENEKNATQLLYGKLDVLTKNIGNELAVNAGLGADTMLAAVCDFVNDAKADEIVKKSIENNCVSMGKVMMSFVGHSLAMSGLFDEVQMFFYPLNSKAGAARVHTTASMPIKKDLLRKAVAKKVSTDASISINTMFNLVERKIIRDNSSFAYGIADVEEQYKKQKEIAKKAAEEALKNPDTKASKDKKAAALETKKLAREARKDSITSKCALFYNSDNGPTAEPEFIRPNISLYIETLPGTSVNDKGHDIPAMASLGAISTNEKESTPKDIKKWQRNICRVHIYDEEAVSKPFESFLNGMISEGGGGKMVVKSLNEASKLRQHLKESDIGADILNLYDDNSVPTQLKSYALKTSPDKIKSAIKRGYPSITYGASTGVIKNMSISSNVSNNVSQVIMISANADTRNAQKDELTKPNLEEMEVVPASVSVEMLGCPYIQRGNQIYLDFGTNTTLDNIYTVKTVKHNISAGNFSTSVDLIFTGQGKVSNIRTEIAAALSAIK